MINDWADMLLAIREEDGWSTATQIAAKRMQDHGYTMESTGRNSARAKLESLWRSGYVEREVRRTGVTREGSIREGKKGMVQHWYRYIKTEEHEEICQRLIEKKRIEEHGL